MNFNKDLRIVNEDVDIRDIIHQVMGILKFKARQTKINLMTQLDKNMPKTIRTEPRRLK